MFEICRLTLHLRFRDLLYWFILGVGLLFLWVPHVPHGATAAPIPLFGSFGEQIFGTFSFLHLAMLVFFALSSRFDTTQRNLGQISHTLPVDRMVWLGGWLLSLVIASAFFELVGGLANLGLQAYYMPQAITLSGHVQSVLLAWIEPLLFGTMSLAVCCFVGSKRTAAFIIALLLLAKFLISACGEPFTLFAPGWMPAIWWSDFTGFQLGLRHWCWYGLYWFAIICILLIIAARAGKHGPSPSTAKRPVTAVWWPVVVPVIASFVSAIAIFYPTSRFAMGHVTALKTRYELLYRHTANELEPRLTKIAGKVVIDTTRGDATADLYYSLHNNTDSPISRFHLDWAPVGEYAVSASGCKNDNGTGFAACALAKPMPPGADQTIALHIFYHHAFGRKETDIGYVTKSAVLLTSSFFPLLGYDPLKEIQDSRDRSKAGLRGPSWTDSNGRDGLSESVFHSQGPVELDIQVSPLRGLTVIGPHHTVDQVEGLAIFAGVLEPTKPVRIDDIPVTIYHHPLHTAMVSVISNVAKQAIRYGVKNFGRPNVEALRLVEADMRHSSGKCLPDTIFLSEGIVFDPHSASPWGHQEDIPSEVVGHEIAHLWWAYQVVPARAPGFPVITESFAQYMSLMLRRDAGGMFAERRMLFKASAQIKGYMESDPDPPVVLSSMRNTNALAYGRGLVTMSIIEKIIGVKELNRVLRRFRIEFDIDDNPRKFATLSDFRVILDNQLSGNEKELIDSLFDTNEVLTVAKWTKIRKLHAEHAHRPNTLGSDDAHHR